MRTFLCEMWLYINILGGISFFAAIYRWFKDKKGSKLLLGFGIACIIIPGFTYLNSVKVINVVGLQVDSARLVLQSSGLLVELDSDGSDSEIILRQSIPPGSYVKKKTTVILYNDAYSPMEELLKAELHRKSNDSLFPAVNLSGLKVDEIFEKYADLIKNIIISLNFRSKDESKFSRNIDFKVFERAGTIYYRDKDSFDCIDLLGEKIATSYLLVFNYDALDVVASYNIENGFIENPFKNIESGRYFIALLSNNYKVYIWGPILLIDDFWVDIGWRRPVSMSFALEPENTAFSDIKCVKMENTSSNNIFYRPYFINSMSITKKNDSTPISSAPASITPTYKDYVALDSSNSYIAEVLPIYLWENSYGYLSGTRNICLFSISEKYMLRIENKKTSWLDLFWKNWSIDIDFSESEGNAIVVDSSSFLK